MIIWLILFLLVIAISFLLAFRSMKDYSEIPQKSNLEYSLFLIRAPQALTSQLLQAIRQSSAKEGLVVSFERLLRGSQSALCIFGPKEILDSFQSLNLLEIEDYTESLNSDTATIWEVDKSVENPFKDLPKLEAGELFLWQVLISGKQIQVRAGIVSKNAARRKEFVSNKLPRPFSTEQMINFYKERSIDGQTAKEIDTSGILTLLLLH